ncbi:Zinc finger C2H2-type,Zinc finger, AD-type,Zinc finger, RING/FYVE/PHD-type [Cinara cedri]|uniref:Zinc finger C2H2-type,Zinc finger, AD-type,Zinc finger, RING/FYVE/PHD-type n=1 Tax=Cinara cedri TaxID=506608 RepID=A0A5E4NQI5_9HEMI|nr:Zinc finger C2H2-type,Zinc finger, AD-type,Zinc finger, RING/FYVE/PHD-type [Cinara cedri]
MDNENQTVIYIHNWNDICRLCLRNDQPLQNIFLEMNMLENIQEITNLSFSEEDSLPNSVCKLCIDQVNSFVEFRVRCKATDEWLRNEATVDAKESENYTPEVIENKDILLVESDQFEEQLIDDPDPVDDDQQIENEIELSHCIVQTEGTMEEVMQITADAEILETNSSDYQCTVCGKELLSAYTLGNHMRSHTGERPYGCSVCEKFFKTKSNLNEHYRVHNPELRWMKTSSRDIPSITRVTVTSEDMLTCSYCSKVFTSLDALSAHERTHDDDELRQQQTLLLQTPEEMLQASVNAVMTFTCEQCNKNFTSKSLLSAHISNNCCSNAAAAAAVGAVVNAAKRPTADHRHRQCPYCNKQFRSAVTLENHKRVHTREKPFGCDACPKVFRTKGNLLEHKRVHNNSLWLMKSDTKLPATHHDTGAVVERFRCTYCAKPFRTYTAMLNHERVHTREKPFECSVCGKLFRTKSNMTEHMKGCHDIDSSACGGTDEVQVFTFKNQAAFCKS